MKHLKLFLEHRIEKEDFPKNGYVLNSRENKILLDLVGELFLNIFEIRKEDNYYYTYYSFDDYYYNQFDGFTELKNYILCRYYLKYKKYNKLLELIKETNLDLSFDDNFLIRFTSQNGITEIVKLLLKDPKVDPSSNANYAIKLASQNGHTEVVKLLLQDPRVDPSDGGNYAIKWASENGHTEVVKLLIKDPRVREKLTEKEIKKYETS